MHSRPARVTGALVFTSAAILLSSVAHSAAPKISGAPAASVTVGQNYSFKPKGTDADGNKLTYSIANKPGWASFNSATGELHGTPYSNHVKTWSGIVISVTDGSTRVSLPAYSLVVKASSNKSPTISGTPATTATIGTAYSFQPTAKDPEGKALTFTIRNKPSWATFNASTGKLSGTPTAAGTTSSIMIIASDGATSTALLPSFDIAVSGSHSASNQAPTITGYPLKSTLVGASYRFVPTAADGNGDRLVFSISNLPSWASFNTTTGELRGTPTSAGTAQNVQIRVSDGKATASLPTFSIAVTAGTVATSPSIALRWAPPMVNDDGTTLTDLAGFRIRYGRTQDNLSYSVTISNPGITRHVLEDLAAGLWHFSIAAFSHTGAESDSSPVLSTTIP